MSGGSIIRVTTFNLRNCGANDGDHRWELRKQLVVDVIRTASPDVVGVQESLPPQQDYLRAQLGVYEHVGVGRDDGDRKGEATTIMFRRDRFDHIDSSTFWLSESPIAVGCAGWDAQLPRICTWACLRDRQTSREVVFLNTHFDHRGVIARLNSAKQINAWIAKEASGMPVALMGDFNADGESEPHQILCSERLRDTWKLAHRVPPAEEGTYHAFTGVRTRERIDWILCSNEFDVVSCMPDYSNRDGCWPSDHFPLHATLQLAR